MNNLIDDHYLISDHLKWLLPKGANRETCPPWPPDVFAIAAHILEKSGAYKALVDISKGGLTPEFRNKKWPSKMEAIGKKWADNFQLKTSFIPKEVHGWWSTMIAHASKTMVLGVSELNPNPEKGVGRKKQKARKLLEESPEMVETLINLCAASDEACRSMREPTARGPIKTQGEYLLRRNNNLSLCDQINYSKIRVMAKWHTPNCGLTLRSISQFLCLIPTTEVQAKWHHPIQLARQFDKLNLLLFPWPLEIEANDFHTIPEDDHDNNSMPGEHYGFFGYQRKKKIPDFEIRVRIAIKRASQYVDRVHGIIFPELSLKKSEYRILEKVAHEENIFFCAGIQGNRKNAVVMDYYGMTRMKMPLFKKAHLIEQDKHHRWFLDRSQILQYGLGGFFSREKHWWEYSKIGDREIHFVTFSNWLTICTLICEDLARQDPVSQIIRAVGPNLVFALLMDGPQLKSRWPSRYAAVLADDPGSSVLSLTGLGMVEMSNRQYQSNSRVVALWKDIEEEMQLELPEGKDVLVLSLSPRKGVEYSADGRRDPNAYYPVFSSLHALQTQDQS